MNSQPYLFVGVMSGTSADGIDTVLVDFSQPAPALLAKHSLAFSQGLRADIIALCASSDGEVDKLGQLDVALAQQYAQAVNELLHNANIQASQVTAIGCHGQTIRHRPVIGASITHPFSLQIGDPHTLAALTGISTVSDFRRKDVALGGQGAPLVPAFHSAMFQSKTVNRCIVNIGGIANITSLPVSGRITGYDTGPGNTLMDAWVEQSLGKKFDEGGQWAATGQVNRELLNHLLSHPYFAKPAPKSTGREEFHLPFVRSCLAKISNEISNKDVQATLLELTAITICNEIQQHSPRSELIICGGGAYNSALVKRIGVLHTGGGVASSETQGVAPTWVEAMAFAWLAMRRVEHLPGNVPEVTGASRLAVLGSIACP